MRIIITTFDGHKNLLEANKYMMDLRGVNFPVTVLGFEPPDFDLGAWRFVSMGKYISPDRFTDDIKPFFDEFTDEYFILGNDDTILTNQFNFKLLDEIVEMVSKISDFGRIWLTGGIHSGGILKDFGNYQIVEIGQTANYRLSLQWSLWKTSYFKRYLWPGLSPWNWELRENAKGDGAAILGINGNFVVSIGHIMKKGKLLPNWYKGIYGDGELTPEEYIHCESILKKYGYL
jgi:hypothetical protein